MKTIDTFEAKIYCGLRAGYANMKATVFCAETTCQVYVNKIGWCVTVTPTNYIYKDGCEKGIIVGIINYPDFPNTEKELRRRTLELAEQLRSDFLQCRVSVVFPDITIMLEDKANKR